jgi:hypothetical protein
MNEAISKDRLLSKNLYLKRFIKKDNKPKTEPKLNGDKLVKLRNLIKNINYTDILFQKGDLYDNEQFYNVEIVNDEINTLLTYAKNYSYKYKIAGEKLNPNKFDINISVGEKDFNRVHFHKSLPLLLRGIGFGYKIYKALALKLGFLSSDNTASFAAQSVWYHLIQDPDFNYIIHKNFVFIVKRNLPLSEKMGVVLSYIKEYDWLFEDESEFDIDDELVQELEEYGNP